MPKRQTQRIIDSRKRNASTTIIGATGSGVPVTLSAGDGLTLTGTTLDVIAGDGVSVAADSVAVDSTVVRTTRTVTAGSGLTGGGALSADLTLNVGAGTLVTVGADSVGITAGANYQFIGTGSGTAAAWQNLSSLAGNGLTADNGVLSVVVAGLGLSVGADAVALASSSNPGAAASILASTASGGLTLQSLAVQGSIDVTNGGDLTVAGSGAYAGNSVLFVDSSGGNVGIMGAPDPQFALDVVGPCRATWFVGPHAIQLKDVLLLAHFDGRQPFATNYTGEPNGHMGQVATTSSLIFRPGKFGTKAAQMSAATANLISNPSFETGTTGWSAWAGATLDQTTADAFVGTYAMRITHVASTTSGATFTHTTATQSTYTASAYVRSYIASDIGDNISLLMRFTYSDASTSDVSVNHTLTSTWTRISVTATTNGAKTLSSVAVHLRDLLSGAAHYSLIDSVQLEESAFATAYCDGSLGSGHSWTGTAHASTSNRTAAQLTYPTAGNIHDEVGTVMAWVYVSRSAGTQTILRITGSTAGNIYLLISSGNLAGYWGTAEVTGTAVSALAWHHVAMTYSGSTLTLYVDGVAVASGTSSGFSGMPTSMSVGGVAGSNLLHGLIDDLVITESALEADGVRAVYESDAPVFAESSRFSFRATPQGLVWADDEGLWMRNESGSAVLGAYGSSSTKSWAGVTLAPSDVVIGDGSRGGYVLWDDSAATLTVQGTITATAGSIGGWTVDSTKLAKDTGTAATSAGLAPSDFPFYAGQTYANRASAPFRVSPAGALTATSGVVGGWTLAATALTAGSGSSTVGLDAGGTNPAIYAGSATPGSAPFRVTQAGALYAEGADIRGAITASSGSITGVLTIGTSGEIRQGTGTLGTDFTGLRIMQSSSIGQVAVYDANVKTMRISSDDVRYKMASTFTDIRTIKWLENTDYTGTWSDLSSANGNYAYIGAYYTSTNSYLYMSNRVNNTGSPANTLHSQISLIASRNESGTVYSKGLQLVTFNSTYSYDGIAFLSMALQLSPIATPTYGLNSSDDAQVYLKGGYIVFRYNDGGTYRYKYLNLAGTGTSWTHSTTAP